MKCNLSLLVLFFSLFVQDLYAETKSLRKSRSEDVVTVPLEAKSTYEDMKKTLGIVPNFFKQYPQEAISGAWEDMKNVQLNENTMIPNKYKELIGMAVSAQIPCRFCTYFHSKSAQISGATPQEIKESVAISGLTRKWSTYYYGTQVDQEIYKKDIDSIVSKIKSDRENARKGDEKFQEKLPPATDAASAITEMKNAFGIAPNWLTSYPNEALAGAWKNFLELEMNPDTTIPSKYKNLISLAVASQVPCVYCTYADTQFARLNGASSEEIREAVAMASIVRQWSTFLNGLQYNEKVFRKEVDQIFNYVGKQMKMKRMAKVSEDSST